MKNITLDKTDIHRGHLILINSSFPYYEDQSLLLTHQNEITLEKKTFHLLHHILKDIHQNNEIILVSGYRTLATQTQIYQQSLLENGKTLTQHYVALPNHSEHQTGYAIDLGLISNYIDFIRPSFPHHGIAQKFRERALQYGFIQRYQKEKEQITKIKEESWHFRYVGIPHATYMYENNLCLEEYIEHIKKYHFYEPLQYYYENRLFSIFYVPLLNKTAQLSLNEKAVYQISGNNVDGFIVTAWCPYP